MNRGLFRIASAIMLGLALASSHARAGFVNGDIFATSNVGSDQNSIAHYIASGAYLGSMSVPSSSIYWSTRGLAVGPDGLLYVVQDRSLDGFAVLAYNSAGVLQQTYTYSGPGNYLGGNISYGKIAFDGSGHFFVGASGGAVEFTTGNTGSGSLFFPTTGNGAFDIKALGNGDLLVASAYDIYEVTPSGVAVRDLKMAGSGPNALGFTDLRGIEYNAATNVLYATMLGYTGHYDQTMKIDYATGNLLAATTFTYGDDLVLTIDGRLLDGSRTQVPEFFDLNLNPLGSLSATPGPRIFVTQVGADLVPEPGSLALLGLGAAAGVASLRRTRRGRSDAPGETAPSRQHRPDNLGTDA